MAMPSKARINFLFCLVIVVLYYSMQNYMKFPNYTQTNKFFVGTHLMLQKKFFCCNVFLLLYVFLMYKKINPKKLLV